MVLRLVPKARSPSVARSVRLRESADDAETWRRINGGSLFPGRGTRSSFDDSDMAQYDRDDSVCRDAKVCREEGKLAEGRRIYDGRDV